MDNYESMRSTALNSISNTETTGHAPAKTVHTVLLDLLKVFDCICAQHNLRYIATHGTLLGAVRDGGFAPGDDDLDVAMPRPDYDRLLQLAEDGVFPNPYFLQTPENEPECFYGGYAKLRDSSTSAIEPPYQDRCFNQGIWMDILPLDNCPKDYRATQKQQRIVRFWQRILYAKTYGLDMRKFWDADPAHVSAYFIAEKHIDRQTACKRLRKKCMAAKPSGQLTVFAMNYPRAPNTLRYNAIDLENATRVSFETTMVPIPQNAEAWLADHYGPTWMIVPRPITNKSAHDVVFDPNVPYTSI